MRVPMVRFERGGRRKGTYQRGRLAQLAMVAIRRQHPTDAQGVSSCKIDREQHSGGADGS
jgi:hypothetical protein